MTDLLPLALASPILLACAYGDLRHMQIPNKLILILIALFVITSPMLAMSEIGWRLVAATVVFSIGSVAFSMRFVGGGDVKMLASLLLFIPSATLITFGYVFSAAMIVGLLVTVTLQSVPLAQEIGWVSVKSKGHFPMGISIALAGLTHPLVVLVLQ